MRTLAVLLMLTLTAATANARSPNFLLLELWVNGTSRHAIVSVIPRGDALLTKTGDLRQAGLILSEHETDIVDVMRYPGITAALDMPQQRLLLSVDAEILSGQTYDLRKATSSAPTRSVPGAILHYGFTAGSDDARHFASTSSVGADLGLDIAADDTLFTVRGFARNTGSHSEAARLDTALEIDTPTSLSHLIVGDTVSGAVTWSRAVRFAGLQYASDFALRPDLVTQPLPTFFGTTAIPTTVQVFAGNAEVFEQNVQPGPFEIRNLPILSNGGSAVVVTTDVLGRQTTQTLSLYSTPDLLAPGFTSFAIDIGGLRRSYGLRSFDYSHPIASGVLRYGLSNGFTVEAHGEAAPQLALIGGGVARGISNIGVVSLDGAISTRGHGEGILGAANFESGTGPLHIFGSFSAASPHYRDIASLDDGTPPSLLHWQVGASLDLHGNASLTTNWIGDKPQGKNLSQFITTSWSASLPQDAFVGITGLHDIGKGSWSVQLFFTLKFGDNYASSALSASPGLHSGQFNYDHPANPDGGIGWRLSQQAGDTSRTEVGVNWIGSRARIAGAAVMDGGVPAVRGDMDGALVMLDDDLFAARDEAGAVALVRTGRPGIHIERENRQIAVSDKDGEALITGLLEQSDNHLSADARDYPMSDVLPPTEITVKPPRRGAVIADFRPIKKTAHFKNGPKSASEHCTKPEVCPEAHSNAD